MQAGKNNKGEYSLLKWIIRTVQIISGQAIWGSLSVSSWCKVKISLRFFFINRVYMWFCSVWVQVLLRSHFHQGYIHLKKNLPSKRKILKSQDNIAKVKEHLWRTYSRAKLKLIQAVFFVIVTSQQENSRCKDIL